MLCVEEAATNAIRHSGSERDIEISLRFEDGDLLAEVKDHGRGFDVAGFDREAQPDLESDHGRGLFIVASSWTRSSYAWTVAWRCAWRDAPRRAQASCRTTAASAMRSPSRLTSGDSRMRAVLEEIDEGFVALDWEYRYTHVNEAMLRLIGRSRDEVLGKVIWELFPELVGSAGARALPRGDGPRQTVRSRAPLVCSAVTGSSCASTRPRPASASTFVT